MNDLIEYNCINGLHKGDNRPTRPDKQQLLRAGPDRVTRHGCPLRLQRPNGLHRTRPNPALLPHSPPQQHLLPPNHTRPQAGIRPDCGRIGVGAVRLCDCL